MNFPSFGVGYGYYETESHSAFTGHSLTNTNPASGTTSDVFNEAHKRMTAYAVALAIAGVLQMSNPSLDMKTAAQNSLVQEIQNNVEKITNGSKHTLADKLAIENDCKCYQNGVVKALESLRNHLKETGTETGQEYLSKLNSVSQDVQEDVEPKKAKDSGKTKNKSGHMSANTTLTLPAVGDLQMQNSTQNFSYIPVDKLRAHPEVKGFYPIFEEVLEGITEGIRESGFDKKFPLQICPDGGEGFYVWDGLTRCAALSSFPDIKEVPAIISEFNSVEELFMAVIRTQGLRRKMTDAMLLKSVEKLQDFEAAKAKDRQGRRNDLKKTSPQDCGKVSMSANRAIALIVGKSEKTIEHAKAVLKNPEFREVVLASEITLNQAYDKLSAMNKPVVVEPQADSQENAALNVNAPAEIPATAAVIPETKIPLQVPNVNHTDANLKDPGTETDKANITTPAVKPKTTAKKTGSVPKVANPVLEGNTKTIVVTVEMLKFLFKYIPEANHKRLLFLNRKCSDEVTDIMRTVPALRKILDAQPLLELKGDMGF